MLLLVRVFEVARSGKGAGTVRPDPTASMTASHPLPWIDFVPFFRAAGVGVHHD